MRPGSILNARQGYLGDETHKCQALVYNAVKHVILTFFATLRVETLTLSRQKRQAKCQESIPLSPKIFPSRSAGEKGMAVKIREKGRGEKRKCQIPDIYHFMDLKRGKKSQ